MDHKIKYKAIMSKEGSTKIVHFIINRAWGFMLGRGYVSYYCEYEFSSTLSIYITLVTIVLRE